MKALARKIEDALEILAPKHGLHDPANDNRPRSDFGSYVRHVRANAGSDYQLADAKLWWVP